MRSNESRRWKAIHVHPEAIIQCFVTRGDGQWTNKLISPELPEDVKVVHVTFDNAYMSYRITLEHESFDEVPFGMIVPTLELTFQAVQMLRYRAADIPRSPDPATLRQPDGTHTLVTWYDSEEEQMKRYGITGWDEKGVAIWEKGRGPSDGTIIVRSPKYREHNFKSLVKGEWTSVGNEFFKREDLERVAKQMMSDALDRGIEKAQAETWGKLDAMQETARQLTDAEIKKLDMMNDELYAAANNPSYTPKTISEIEKILRDKEKQSYTSKALKGYLGDNLSMVRPGDPDHAEIMKYFASQKIETPARSLGKSITNSATETLEQGFVKIYHWEKPIAVTNGEYLSINGDRVEHYKEDGTLIDSHLIMETKETDRLNTPGNTFRLEKVNIRDSYGTILQSQPLDMTVKIVDKLGVPNDKPVIEDPFMKIWAEKGGLD